MASRKKLRTCARDFAISRVRSVKDRIIHYVPRWQALDWLRLGWIILRPRVQMPHHDQYVVHMEWLCDCKMRRPQ
jgi:hypothetical protein